MNIFWTLNAQRVKKYLIFVVAALFAAGVIYVERDALSVFGPDHLTFSPVSADDPQAIYNVQSDESKIALTFNISWGSEFVGPITEILVDKDVQATFFLSSPWAEAHPDIVQSIQEAGFEIGSQGHKHTSYNHLEDDEIRQQITNAQSILHSLTGERPSLFRPPNGHFDKRVIRIANELDYAVIMWDTDSQDWLVPGTEQIVNNVLNSAHPGDIVLMHASDSAKQTQAALPVIVDRLKSEGYQFVTVTDLITGKEERVQETE